MAVWSTPDHRIWPDDLSIGCHHHLSISQILSLYQRSFANFHGSPVFHALGVLSCTDSFSPQARVQYAYE